MKAKTQSKRSKIAEDFTNRFFEHAEIKKACMKLAQKSKRNTKMARRSSRITSLPKAPKLLLQAIDEDERILELTHVTRNVVTYYRELSKLLEEKAKGKKQNEKMFIKKWLGIEKDYQTMLKLVCTIYRENPLLMASGKALAETPDDLDVFANPAFLGKDELAVAKYIGLTTNELTINFEHSYLPNRNFIASGLASEKFENALKSIEKASKKIPFLLSPKYLIQESGLTVGGDFFFLLNLFQQIISVITTIVAVVAVAAAAVAVAATAVVTTAASAVAQAATAVVQTAASVVEATSSAASALETNIEYNLDDLGDWFDEQGRKLRDWYDRNVKPLKPKVEDPNPDFETRASWLVAQKITNSPGEKGDKFRVVVFARDTNGAPINDLGQRLQMLYGLEPIPPDSFVLKSMPWINRPADGAYVAVWGPGYWTPPLIREVKFTYTVISASGSPIPGNWDGGMAIPSNSNGATLIQALQDDIQSAKSWQSSTKVYAPEETVKLYGYVLGNISRTKMELHLPNCSFLHLISPKNIQQFDTIQDGHNAGLDNCYYCIGDSER